MSSRLPAIFVGHGNPMNAISQNAYTQGWEAIGKNMPRPKSVLAISAHWYLPATLVTGIESPPTIHDFGGFPPELFRFQYSAPGDIRLAERVREVLQPLNVGLDRESGLDHGTWSVLCHIFPNADVPVVQLSIDETKPPRFHYELARQLSPLRDEGVLILGSGNLVHNLHSYAWGRHAVEAFPWAVRFETLMREHLVAGNHEPLINYESTGQDAVLSVPTPEHYLPLLYVIGTQQPADNISFPVEGVDGGSISMLAVQIG